MLRRHCIPRSQRLCCWCFSVSKAWRALRWSVRKKLECLWGESLVQPLYWEGDGTPVTMFLKCPLGEKGLICNGFDKNFSLSPSSLVCQGISAEKRPHPHYTPETWLARRGFLHLRTLSYVPGAGKHSEETLALFSNREPALERSLSCVQNVGNPLTRTLFLKTTDNLT